MMDEAQKKKECYLTALLVGAGLNPQIFQLIFSQSSEMRAIYQSKSNVRIPTAAEQNLLPCV